MTSAIENDAPGNFLNIISENVKMQPPLLMEGREAECQTWQYSAFRKIQVKMILILQDN